MIAAMCAMPTSLPTNFQLTPAAPLSTLSTGTLVVNLLFDAVLASALAWYYVRYGRSLSNRAALARTLPFVSLTTVLIISVVKSSLALSLGLVGALSIVRFRTPVKEPEELAYLFLSIALGLGLGADQRTATGVAFLVIVGILSVRTLLSGRRRGHNLYLNIEVTDGDDEASTFEAITRMLAEHVSVADLRRLDVRDNVLQAAFYIDCKDQRALVAVMDALKRGFPDAAISFVDQEQVLGV